MYLMADGLTRAHGADSVVHGRRALAVSPGAREESVHIALFPSGVALVPLVDRGLLDRWGKLIALREDVLAEIEPLRKNKQIGSSLQAKAVISATTASSHRSRRTPRSCRCSSSSRRWSCARRHRHRGARRGAAARGHRTRERREMRALLVATCRRYPPSRRGPVCGDRCQDALAETVNG